MEKKNTLSIVSLCLSGVSLLILPPFLGLAAFILGIIATVKKEKLGILALILGLVLPVIGRVIGALVTTAMLG